MSTPAGWYPQADGQQRYWDGEQWTEHFAPGTPLVTPPAIARKNWFLRHKVITAVGAVLLLAIFSNLANGGSKSVNIAPAADSVTTSSAADQAAADKAAADKAAADKAAVDQAAADKAAAAKAAAAKAAADKAAILTVKNNKDLATLLAKSDDCSDMNIRFAAKYIGRTIEFDGNIGAMQNHGDYNTRYDILILAGDYSESSAIGPFFQFRDVNTFDLHLTGSNVPDSVGTGDNLHIIARVGDFNSTQCHFFLEPVSTEVR